MNAIQLRQAAIEKANAEISVLTAITPYIVGEPKQIIPHRSYGSIAMICYKVREAADLATLIEAYPPVETVKCKQGGCVSIIPADQVRECDQDSAIRADGVYFDVDAAATVGAYPCDEHALAARWYSDTPAGRVNVRVDFHHNTRPDWPRLWIKFRNVRNGEIGKHVVEAWDVSPVPSSANVIKYPSVDATHPGSALLWFRADSGERAAWLASLSRTEG